MTPSDKPESETPEQEANAAEEEAVEESKPEPAKSDEPEIPQPRPDEVVPVLEGLLFATTSPLTMKRLQYLTGNLEEEEIKGAINELRERYEKPNSGLMVMEVASGYQIATRPSVADWVLALHKHRRKNPISPAVMETLAIIAYKQPVVKAEVESIRGVDSGGVMRSLLDAGLVEVVGTKDVIGRPSLYGTSDTFLKTFGLKSLEELPSIVELKEILETPMQGSKKAEEEEDSQTDIFDEESSEQETIIEDDSISEDQDTVEEEPEPDSNDDDAENSENSENHEEPEKQ